jgi:DNA topoisomerase-3
MSDRELAVYRLIRAHYLAQFLPHHAFDRTTARLSCGGQVLRAVGKQVVELGWRLVLDEPELDDVEDESATRNQMLPPLQEGLLCQISGVALKARKTAPPRPFTQGELVKAMKTVARLVSDPRLKQTLNDSVGIGTEATRASIINGLLARGYLVKKGRGIRASEAAFTLIDTVPAAIADPGTTAVWEQALELIESGQLSLATFIEKQSAWITQLVTQYRGTTLSIKVPEGPACPECGATTRQRSGKNGAFWSCSRYPDCKGTLPVPSGKRGATRKRRTKLKAAR